ncbi:MAG TPA: MYXO-CTERM sorting domain-containing protein [Kofleriaceae bacterium]|nr:MYXO-CTERM sorting domain-containing protein [Kofleriaceae bacterium]
MDSGCGCSGGGNPAGSWPLLGAIGLLFRRRRRR